jgi:hypothetical protein
MLRLNFFAVWLPEDEQPLPLWVRPRSAGAKLESFEQELILTPPQSERAAPATVGTPSPLSLSVAVGPFDGEFRQDAYRVEPHKVREILPSIVKRLVSSGLEQALAEKGLHIESDPMGFACFDPNLTPDSPMPEAVTLRKGAQFRRDHLVVRGRRIYGFFISPVTRLFFQKLLTEDEALGRAIEGERVDATLDGRVQSADLLSIDFAAKQARVVFELQEYQIPLERVHARATTRAVGRYFELIGRSADARLVRLAPQIANYRLLPSGQRNRRWLAQQYEFVSSWLVGKSESGRLQFQWPQSSTELYVQTEALRITGGGT